jgi:hypothetical protein
MSSHFEVTVDILAAPDRIWAGMDSLGKERSAPGWGSLWLGQRNPHATTQTGYHGLAGHQFSSWNGVYLGGEKRRACTAAEHKVIQKAANDCTVVLTIRQTGFLIPILSPFISRLTRRYMQMEAQGLKQRCEDPGMSS